MTVTVATQELGEQLLDELMTLAPHPDPYPVYRPLREISPLWRSERYGIVFVSGYAENVQLHQNPDCSSTDA